MATLPAYPGWIGLNGGWVATVHFLDSKDPETGGLVPAFDAVVVSFDNEGELKLNQIKILPAGQSGFERLVASPEIRKAPDGWMVGAIPESRFFEALDPVLVAEHFSASTARNLLTGHILALRLFDLIAVRKGLQDSGTTARLSLPRRPVDSVIRATARLYEELQSWGESTPAWIIAELEGVSINTIYNRLNVARKKEFLTKPGPGARRKKA